MTGLTDRIVEALIANGSVDAEEKELYAYGLREGILILLNILTTAVIGLVFGAVWYSLLFLAAYIPLRIYAGGYHARTQLRCYLFSVAQLILIMYLLTNMTGSLLLIVFGITVSGVIIWFFAPVEDENKPLSETEIKVYRKITRRVFLVEVGVILLFTLLSQLNIAATVTMALIVSASMLLIGKVSGGKKEGGF